MFFYLLMQPNHIETLHRKVCMRINEDYYIENVYTLIRVPNNNANLGEFASRYFCLQSDSTHNVYVVWKRRNRVKRIDKRSPPKSLSGSVERPVRSKSGSFKVRPSSLLGKRAKSIKRIVRRDSVMSLNESSSDSSSPEYFTVENRQSRASKSKQFLLKLPLLKHLPVKSLLSKFAAHRPKDDQNKIKKLNKKHLMVKNRPNYQKFDRLPKGQLLRVITNKLKSFSSKVEDASTDSILIHLNSPTRKVLLDHQSETDNLPHETSRPPSQENRNQLGQERNPKKLFSNLIDKLSCRTSRLVHSLKSTKDDELARIKVAKKKVKCVVSNISHNLINLITPKQKRD